MVGQLEAALEAPRRDAAIEVLHLFALGRGLLAADRQAVLLDGDVEVVLGEARHRHGDAVVVVADLFDVVGRIAVAVVEAGLRVQQIHHAVETDGGAHKGGEINTSHSHILLLSNMVELPGSTTIGRTHYALLQSGPEFRHPLRHP